jgi:hypothetical protein
MALLRNDKNKTTPTELCTAKKQYPRNGEVNTTWIASVLNTDYFPFIATSVSAQSK